MKFWWYFWYKSGIDPFYDIQNNNCMQHNKLLQYFFSHNKLLILLRFSNKLLPINILQYIVQYIYCCATLPVTVLLGNSCDYELQHMATRIAE